MADDVNVIDPSGKLGSLPADRAQIAVAKYGYKVAPQEALDEYKNQQQYGEGTGNEAKAFLEGAGRGATFGGSTYLEKFAGVDPEAIRQRQLRNPLSSTAGEITGAVGGGELGGPVAGLVKGAEGIVGAASPLISRASGLLVNPETSPMISGIITKATQKALGSSIEGAAFGAGQSVHEQALGDPDAMGEKLMSNLGYGSLFGGGLGGTLGAVSGAYSGMAAKSFSKAIENKAVQDAIAENASKLNPIGPSSIEVEGAPTPTSLEDIQQRVKDAKYMGMSSELPSKQLLIDSIQNSPPSQFPVHQLQIESLSDPAARDIYKTFIESGSDEGNAMRDYESLQKQEAVSQTKSTIGSIAPQSTVTEDAVNGGNKLVKAFTDQYKNEQKELAPLFKKFDSAAINPIVDRDAIMSRIGESIPEAQKYIEMTPEGYKLSKYSPTMPFTKTTYGALSDVIDSLNTEDLTIGGLRNLRKNIGTSVNFLSNPAEASEIGSLKKGLMDIIQDNVQKMEPDLQVRDTFKRYAINEENRSAIEKIFGGSISDKAGFSKQIKPEDVLDHLFGNTVAVKAAKEILGPKFDEGLANYLASKVAKNTDLAKNGFSSNKFGTFLKSKSPELQEAFLEKPDTLKKIQSLNDKMRILPDSPSVNPSGTAKTTTIMQKLLTLGHYITPEGALSIPGQVAKGIAGRLENIQQKNLINTMLKKGAIESAEAQNLANIAKTTVLGNMERVAQKTNQKITSSAKSIFNFSKEKSNPVLGYAAGKLADKITPQKHKDIADNLKEFQSNPEKMMDQLHNVTKDIYAFAPQVTGSVQMAASRATQFLASKLPQGGPQTPLGSSYIPSMAEIMKFEQYNHFVENPLSVLDHVKSATLTPEALETMINVYPKLYDQMRTEVLGHMTNFISKHGPEEVPYKTKMSLSLFMGQDMDNSLAQPNIASNQMALMGQGAQQAQNHMEQRVKTSQTGLSKLTVADNALTSMQKTAQREKDS